jgi:DNA-binding NtrC family response regulator
MIPDRPLKVLLVDDEPLIRWAVMETLTQAGHSVVEAGDGASAIRAMHDAAPIDVVLLDLCLPDSDDLGLLSNIRRQSPSTAVVLMTAHGSRETTDEALALGAYEVMAKPFDLARVETVLCEAHAAATH